jgi:hypothetical protein
MLPAARAMQSRALLLQSRRFPLAAFPRQTPEFETAVLEKGMTAGMGAFASFRSVTSIVLQYCLEFEVVNIRTLIGISLSLI